MKREPRLRLVPRTRAGSEEPPFTEEELREATALRESLERGGDPLGSALRAAWEPAPLDEGDLDALLERALGEGEAEAPPTRLEREGAEVLRAELASGEATSDAARLATALRAAHAPAALSPERNAELVDRALQRHAGARVSRLRRLAPVVITALSGVTALAAGFALLFQSTRGASPLAPEAAAPRGATLAAAVAPAALIRSRSTDDLFDPAQKFELGEGSSRIDRIAGARASDLRNNRFAAWGVR